MTPNENKVTERFLFKSDSIFASLPQEVREDFLGAIILKQFKKGQNIFTEGNFPAGIYYVKSGKVKKYKSLNNGKEQIIYVCCEGELFGYAPYLSEERYPDSAAALTDASIGFISKEKLIRLLDLHDEFSKMLMQNLSHEFGVLVNFIANYTQKNVRERLALALLILNEKFKDSSAENEETKIVLTREDLANMVGVAIETVVRMLREFKEEKLIEIQGRQIIVKDKPGLFEIADVTDTF
jgi:CRP-like cAMP-binding protein